PAELRSHLFFALPYRRCGAHYAYWALQRQHIFSRKVAMNVCLTILRTTWCDNQQNITFFMIFLVKKPSLSVAKFLAYLPVIA
ncbi:hypothetical protein, partial [Mangrovibacter sp. MFB070]|uniref:hypothetical protein n=1 Tax=Mangrovibacter sp. MFB070 TaxID=1224318 RepID=UPI001F26D5BA